MAGLTLITLVPDNTGEAVALSCRTVALTPCHCAPTVTITPGTILVLYRVSIETVRTVLALISRCVLVFNYYSQFTVIIQQRQVVFIKLYVELSTEKYS